MRPPEIEKWYPPLTGKELLMIAALMAILILGYLAVNSSPTEAKTTPDDVSSASEIILPTEEQMKRLCSLPHTGCGYKAQEKKD